MGVFLSVVTIFVACFLVAWGIVEVLFRVSGIERQRKLPIYDNPYNTLTDGSVGYRRSNSGFVIIKGDKE